MLKCDLRWMRAAGTANRRQGDGVPSCRLSAQVISNGVQGGDLAAGCGRQWFIPYDAHSMMGFAEEK